MDQESESGSLSAATTESWSDYFKFIFELLIIRGVMVFIIRKRFEIRERYRHDKESKIARRIN